MARQQHVRPLTEDEQGLLAEERAWVADAMQQLGIASEDAARQLDRLAAMVRDAPHTAHPDAEFVAYGTALGDLIASETGMRWVGYHDEYGDDLALHVPGKAVHAFPRDMLIKRYERGDAIDLPHLFAEVCAHVNRQARDAADLGGAA